MPTYIDSRYHALGIIGFLCTCLLVGKLLRVRLRSLHHYHLPASIIGAVMGAVVFAVASQGLIDGDDWNWTLVRVEICLINFVFTALFLGFRRSKSSTYSIRDTLRLVWHEGVPQLVYSEIVSLGQNVVALSVSALLRNSRPQMSVFMGGLVVMGLEAGSAVLPPEAVDGSDETENLEYAQEADALGLIISLVLCLVLVNARYFPWVRRLLGDTGKVAKRTDVLEVEHFQRGGRNTEEQAARLKGPPPLTRRNTTLHLLGDAPPSPAPPSPAPPSPMPNLKDPAAHRSAPEKRLHHMSLAERGRVGSLMPNNFSAVEGEVFSTGYGTGTAKSFSPGIGGHLGLIVISIYLAYLASLCLDEVEDASSFLSKYSLLSGFELWPWCMFFALLLVRICFQNKVSFHFAWFHRLAGVFCDVLVVSAVSSLQLPLESHSEYGTEFFLILGSCVAWQIFSFVVLAPRLFPNYFYERGVAELGDMLGHSWTALVILKEMDPLLQTPVPLSFAYKQIVYMIVPGPGFKNTLVIMMLDLMGEWPTVLVLLGAMLFWVAVFYFFYLPRWSRAPKKAGGLQRQNTFSPSPSPLKRSTTLKGATEPLIDQFTDIEEVEVLDTDSSHGGEEEGEEDVRLPELVGESCILDEDKIRELVRALPHMYREDPQWRLVYNLQEDGALLQTLLQNCDDAREAKLGPQLILVEDNWGYVFGGFVTEPLMLQPGFYGTGQSFVFSFHPEFEAFPWAGGNDMFVMSNSSGVGMGGGGGGFAFYLDDELDHGTSARSATFENPRLSSSERFRCLSVEVWAV